MKPIIVIITVLFTMVSVSNSYAQETKDKSNRKELREQRKAEKDARKEEKKAERETRRENQKDKSDNEAGYEARAEVKENQQGGKANTNNSNNSNTQHHESLTKDDINKPHIKTEASSAATSTNHVGTYNKPQTAERKADKKDDNNTEVVLMGLIAAFVIYVVLSILRKIYSKKCKKCGKFWAMKETGESQYLGLVKKEKKKDSQNNIYYVYHNKIGYTCQCKHCGYKEHRTRIEKGEEQ